MFSAENPGPVQKAIAAVQGCADSLEARAVSLQQALPPLPNGRGDCGRVRWSSALRSATRLAG